MKRLFDLAGKVALVTGGSRGIGTMAARGLLEAGARVHVVSRNADSCAATVDELRAFGDVHGQAVDLSTVAACTDFARSFVAVEPRLHVLVNNAGTAWGAPLGSFPADGWDKVLDLNLKSPFFLTEALLPALRAAASETDPARIVNIGSIDGLRVAPGMGTFPYAASKAGLHHLTRVLAVELGPESITVNAVAPGLFATKMTASHLEKTTELVLTRAPIRRIGAPDDIAGVVVFLAGAGGAYVTGAVIPVDGGASLAAAL